MCKAPKPPKPQDPEKPEFLRNRYLDAAIGQSGMVQALRTGRSRLRIPLGDATTTGRQPGEALVPAQVAQPTGQPAPPRIGPQPIMARRGTQNIR